VSSTFQQDDGRMNAHTVGASNGYCIGANKSTGSCITAWLTPPACPNGGMLTYNSSGTPVCANIVSITEPGSCSNGYCSPNQPVAQALCMANGYGTLLGYKTGYGKGGTTKYCGDYNFSTNQWGCDGSCSSSCTDAITSVTCTGTYGNPGGIGNGGEDPTNPIGIVGGGLGGTGGGPGSGYGNPLP
jgi:hypothetical protein